MDTIVEDLKENHHSTGRCPSTYVQALHLIAT